MIIATSACFVALVLGLIFITMAPAYAYQYDGDYHISATTKQNDRSMMALAIEENSVVAYSYFTWAIYLAVESHVLHHDADGSMIVDAILGPGLHFFSYRIDPDEHSKVNLVWKIGAETTEYNLRIASTAQQAYRWQTDDEITISAQWLSDQQKAIAIGCIACALIPAISIIPILRMRADNDVYEVL